MAKELDAIDYLGYPLNLTDITPLDIGAVEKNILFHKRLLAVDSSKVHDVQIRGDTYSVPSIVGVATDVDSVQGEYISFENGTEAAKHFSDNASSPLQYLAVSGTTTSCARAAQKTFLKDKQYAFFSYTEELYTVRLKDYAGSLVESSLVTALNALPKSFHPSDANCVQKYKEFFRDNGSHVIITANYGARYPLKVWASNKSEDVNKVFNACVKAKFNGIPSGGDFDASIKSQNQYKLFEEYFRFLVTVSGGGDSSKLANAAGTYGDFTTWIQSIKHNEPRLLSFQVVELWALMNSPVLKDYAGPLQAAFLWIVDHPEIYKTAVTLDIQTDWAEFNLLTPSAVIIPDPDHPYPSTKTVACDSRVKWGGESSNEYDHKTLKFFVINDGSPIDFSTSHGSHSAGSSTGKVIVTFAGKSYTNDKITDNALWNTEWFFHAPVNNTPEPSRLGNSEKTSYTWDEVLQEYLSANKVSPCT